MSARNIEANVLVIWGRNNSINVQKVLWCCEEMDVKYERVDAGGAFGVVNSTDYRKLNPNGLVPTIEDEGFVLWESNVIVRYLAARHAARTLWPEELTIRAQADQWMDWSNTTVWPNRRPLFSGLMRTAPDKRNPNELEASRANTALVLRIADAHLRSQEYLAGPAFTVADIPLGCVIWRWMALPIERPDLPDLRRWFDSLSLRPAYKKVVMLSLS